MNTLAYWTNFVSYEENECCGYCPCSHVLHNTYIFFLIYECTQ
jgi:hypothetical protein